MVSQRSGGRPPSRSDRPWHRTPVDLAQCPFVGGVSLSAEKRLRPAPGDGDPDKWCDLGCGFRTRPKPLENASALSSSISERYNDQKVAVATGETTALTMVASPRAPGMIRSDYSVAVRKALRAESDKDLVRCPSTKSRNSCWREPRDLPRDGRANPRRRRGTPSNGLLRATELALSRAGTAATLFRGAEVRVLHRLRKAAWVG
jgi:hypothetical protein